MVELRSLVIRRAVLGACASLAVFAAAVPASAQSRGPLVVLGLRAPNGDDDLAGNATTALRAAASTAGFTVPGESPALEQSMAAFSCDDSLPRECLAQIAGDLHAQRVVYGSIRRHGRGRTAPLQVEVRLYDASAAALSAPQSYEVERAVAQDAEQLRGPSRQLIDALVAPAAASSNTSGSVLVPPPPSEPHATGGAPVRRYLGYAMIGLGGAAVIGGAITGFMWIALAGSSNDPNMPSDYLRFQPVGVNQNDGGAVCTRANQDAGGGIAYAATAAGTCNYGYTLSSASWTLLVGGAGVAAIGAVLAVTDHTGSDPAVATNAERRAFLSRPRFGGAPVMAPGYTGFAAGLQF